MRKVLNTRTINLSLQTSVRSPLLNLSMSSCSFDPQVKMVLQVLFFTFFISYIGRLCAAQETLTDLPQNFTLAALNTTTPNSNSTGVPLVLGQNGKIGRGSCRNFCSLTSVHRRVFWNIVLCDVGESVLWGSTLDLVPQPLTKSCIRHGHLTHTMTTQHWL